MPASPKHGNGEAETLAIPSAMRAEVDDRDLGFCRVCGQYAGARRAQHHIIYGGDEVGLGGRRLHRVDNIITVGYLFEHDCHSIVHSNYRRWVPLLQAALANPGTTALQHMRWARRLG